MKTETLLVVGALAAAGIWLLTKDKGTAAGGNLGQGVNPAQSRTTGSANYFPQRGAYEQNSAAQLANLVTAGSNAFGALSRTVGGWFKPSTPDIESYDWDDYDWGTSAYTWQPPTETDWASIASTRNFSLGE